MQLELLKKVKTGTINIHTLVLTAFDFQFCSCKLQTILSSSLTEGDAANLYG